ncbi:MAG: peptidoglycan DD-metalloendopeptidase family protein [Pseudomonadota bacterium]
MKKIARALMLSAVLLLQTGCALDWDESQPRPRRAPSGQYTVQPGDTLYGIAARFGLDHKSVARWNGLSDASRIYPGQRLRLSAPPRAAKAASGPAPTPVQPVSGWRWPTTGKLVSGFDESASTARTGILVAGQIGQPVLAAAGGKVVYAGSGLKGYGKLIVIQHNDDVLSAYGHNASLLVSEGDSVRTGQKIATMGEAAAERPRLHFEIRERGQPVNPLRLLPPR